MQNHQLLLTGFFLYFIFLKDPIYPGVEQVLSKWARDLIAAPPPVFTEAFNHAFERHKVSLYLVYPCNFIVWKIFDDSFPSCIIFLRLLQDSPTFGGQTIILHLNQILVTGMTLNKSVHLVRWLSNVLHIFDLIVT